MKINNMTNEETKDHLLKWCDDGAFSSHGNFAWPTDACGYDQHIKFVDHRNKNWQGETPEEFIEFIRDYANSLV